jgi:16S rRNA processing protein RimM
MYLHPYASPEPSPGAQRLPSRLLLFRDGATQEIAVVGARPVREGFLIRFDGVADRDAAALLVGREVRLPRRLLPELGAAEFYVEDIVDCEVVDTSGRMVGRVRGTFWNGAHDVMVIVDSDGGERFVPVVAEYVLSFDGDGRRLVVDPHD